MKKNRDFLKNMPPIHRRELLKKASLLAASPLIPQAFSTGFAGLLGNEALAQAADAPMYFLEVNFRDQWDMGCAFFSPSIARDFNNLGKDGDNGIAFFDAPTQVGNHYLTREGLALRDHVDSIAVMETGELVIGGVHGHEAGNGLRSPGRSYDAGAGRSDMSGADPRPNGNKSGNEVLFSSTPTPAVLYNHYSKSKDADLKNGILLRSSIRANSHTFYHFNANLNNAQLDRFFERNQFFNHFSTNDSPQNDVLRLYRADLLDLVKQLDTRFLKEIQLNGNKGDGHMAALALAAKKEDSRLTKENLQLTDEEKNFWTSGIPGQFECPGDNSDQCQEREGTMNIGEMFAYVAKLFKSGNFRSIAVDFDFHDVHTARTPSVLNNQGKQFSLSLSRLIKTLKDAGIYDRTVIAMYTLDGSRSPRRNSTGDGSKNAFVLAGGGIKGGYYGDVSVKNDGVYYHRPDDKGNAIADGTRDKDKRVANADVYKTVTKALGIPDSVVDQFPDAKGGKPLNFMLKS